MARETIEAPTDPQLLTIRHMCAERGLERPEVVWSKREASEIISGIIAGTYRPNDYRQFEVEVDEDEVPF